MKQSNFSQIDYNRSGIPLLEIVSEPDMETPQEAREFLEQLTLTLSYLNVFDSVNGLVKADCNLSVNGGDRVEIKNVSGLRNVEKALSYEQKRQFEAVKKGEKIVMETRGFDDQKFVTRSLRAKETEDEQAEEGRDDDPAQRRACALDPVHLLAPAVLAQSGIVTWPRSSTRDGLISTADRWIRTGSPEWKSRTLASPTYTGTHSPLISCR